MLRIAVIGGGISGLAAAHRLHELAQERSRPIEVTLLEATQRLGGPLHTVRREGFTAEAGADSFIIDNTAALELGRRLGLESRLVSTQEQFRRAYVLHSGRLVEIPRGFSLLAPSRLWPVLQSPLFSIPGKVRIALERFIPARYEDGDESLGSFVTRRLGKQTLERLVQPLAGGIYGADPFTLSMQATMPRFVAMERRWGSVTRGLRAANHRETASGARWNLFLSFEGGIQTIVDALAERLAGSIRLGAEVVSLASGGENRWRLACLDGTTVEADGVICALPAYAAAHLLHPHSELLGSLLSKIAYSSIATINFALPLASQGRPLDSFGFVVPTCERRRIMAVSFTSRKFDRRAPDGFMLARAFVGGATGTEVLSLSDPEIIAAACGDLVSILGAGCEPRVVHFQRWADSMPLYAVGHLERVREIEDRVHKLPRFFLAGAAYRGVGIPNCIESGESAAEALLEATRV